MDIINYLKSEINTCSMEQAVGVVPIKKNRCNLSDCNKRLTLVELSSNCKCGNTYCTSHKHSKNHNCVYDYKKDNNHNLYKVEFNKIIKI